MKFLADENVDREIVERLRLEGQTVHYIAETNRGVGDDEVLERAGNEQAVLITGDRDFGELVFRQKRANFGVILLRLSGLSQSAKANVVAEVIQQHLEELPGNFMVILPGFFRIRTPV